MSEENQVSQSTTDQTTGVESTTTDGAVNWEKKYQEEIKASKGYRQRAQSAEGKLEQHTTESDKARKKKMEQDGKLKELITEQDKVIEVLTAKAEAGDKLIKDQHTQLLEQLPEEDRDDFKDLPYSQLSKVVTKLKATESIKPEIPSVKGALKGSTKDLESFWEMSKDEKDANWDDTLAEYKKRHNLNKN